MSIIDYFASKETKTQQKDIEMAPRKTTINYSTTDGIEPEGDAVLKLKAPMALDLKEDQTISVSLGITFRVPLVLVQTEGLLRRGVKLLNCSTIVEPGREVVLHLHSEGIAMFERGEVVAAALPLTAGFKLERE